MAKPLLSDELWNRIQPLLPAHPPRPRGGRPRLSDRAALTGILFVLTTGIPWEYLPQELGCGCGMTCWRRLRDWTEAGLWRFILAHLHQDLGLKGRIRWERALVDSSLVPAKRGVNIPDPTPATAAVLAASTI
jgi:transposase